jgi:PAS domain S-box-containing protein
LAKWKTVSLSLVLTIVLLAGYAAVVYIGLCQEFLWGVGVLLAIVAWIMISSFVCSRTIRKVRKERDEAAVAAYNEMPVMLAIFDQTGRVGLWNELAQKTFGYTAREIIKSIDPLMLLLQTKEAADKAGEQLATGDGTFYEYTLHAKNGERFLQLWSAKRRADGTVQWVGYDSGKTAEMELCRLMLQGSPDAQIVLTAEGTITFAAPRTALILGYESAEKLRNRNIREFLSVSAQEKMQLLLEKIPGPVKLTLIRQAGGEIPVEANSAWLKDEKGTVTGIMLILRELNGREGLEYIDQPDEKHVAEQEEDNNEPS